MLPLFPLVNLDENMRCFTRDDLFTQQLAVTDTIDFMLATTEAHRVNQTARNVQMWERHEVWLCDYGIRLAEYWVSLGWQDIFTDHLKWQWDTLTTARYSLDRPYWLGNEDLHTSHRVHLMKSSEWYRDLWTWEKTPLNTPLYWPTRG